jgi:hypothetical protein
MTRTLEGDAEGALVSSAGAGLATRLDLGPLRQVLAKAGDILVVDCLDFVHTESAYLAARYVAVARARTTTRTAEASTASGPTSGPTSAATSVSAASAASTTVATTTSAWAAIPTASAVASAVTARPALRSRRSRAPSRGSLRTFLLLRSFCSSVVCYIILICHFSVLILAHGSWGYSTWSNDTHPATQHLSI